MLSRRTILTAVCAGVGCSVWLRSRSAQHSSALCPVSEYITVDKCDNTDSPSSGGVERSLLLSLECCQQCDHGSLAALTRCACRLSRLTALDEWRSRQLAQRIRWRTALLLALWRRCDLALFLPPPPLSCLLPPPPHTPPPPPSSSVSISGHGDRTVELFQHVLDFVLAATADDDSDSDRDGDTDECSQFWRSVARRALPPDRWRCAADSRYCLTESEPTDASDDPLSWRSAAAGRRLRLRRWRMAPAATARHVLAALLAATSGGGSGSCSRAVRRLAAARHQLLAALAAVLPDNSGDAALCALAARLLDRLVWAVVVCGATTAAAAATGASHCRCGSSQPCGGAAAAQLAASLHATGWLAALAAWSRELDARIALPAARALRHLALATGLVDGAGDGSSGGASSPGHNCGVFSDNLWHNLFIVHPSMMAAEPAADFDVVFVHGLLGGAGRTWRQHDSAVAGAAAPGSCDGHPAPSLWQRHVLRRSTTDLIVSAQAAAKDSTDSQQTVSNVSPPPPPPPPPSPPLESVAYTQCWPRDWLPGDLAARLGGGVGGRAELRARVLLVDYDSRWTRRGTRCSVSSTTSSSSSGEQQDTAEDRRWLLDRGQQLLASLQAAGVGSRPVVFVGHSLGGLLVKQMLVLSAAETASSASASSRPTSISYSSTTSTSSTLSYSTPSTTSTSSYISNTAISSNTSNISTSSATTAAAGGGAGAVWRSTRGVVFAAVPHRGSATASLMHEAPWHRLVQPSLELSQLQLNNQQLLQLHCRFQQLLVQRQLQQQLPQLRILSVLETAATRLAAGWHVQLVSEESAAAGGVGVADTDGAAAVVAPPGVDHLSVCKPRHQHCPVYCSIVDFIGQCVESERKSTQFEHSLL